MQRDEWKVRLKEVIEADGRSLGAISVAAGQSRNYLGSVLRDGADPTIGKLLKVCEALNVSAVYILAGTEASPETVELMALLEKRPEARSALRSLLGDPKAAE